MRASIKKVIISGGGTGGHIFPALAIADTLRLRYPEINILFIGAEGRMEMSRVPAAGYEIVGLPVEGLKRRQLWKNVGVIKNFVVSLVMARRIIKEFAPDVVIGVGGYASAPTLKAAQSLGIPTLIQEQNSYAGVTNKLLARRANSICVAYPDMQRFFPRNKIVLTGNPIRPQIEQSPLIDRLEALRYFSLPQTSQTVLLIVGGSLGAKTINESIAQGLELLARSGVAIIWQTGKDYEAIAKRLLSQTDINAYCNAFVDRMDYAYAAADLVISRAGASSISELCLLGKASILVPSPNVAEDHQTKNALALSSRDAAVLVKDNEARSQLIPKALELLNNHTTLNKLSHGASLLALRDAAQKIVDEVELLTHHA